MESSFYQKKWSDLKNKNAGNDDLKRLSRQIAYSFLDFYIKNCHYKMEYIDLLCEMTTFSDDPKQNNPGAKALFGIIIESLCDDFEELQTETYNRVMAQVISYCRRIPEGKALDQSLKDFGIFSFNDLFERINRIRSSKSVLNRSKPVHKILLLSRVTIGADVAITSVIIQRLLKIFPGAEIVLVGAGKLDEIYGGNSKIKIRNITYSRKGGLLERLSSWHLVLKIVQEETALSSIEKTILIDPDSRLSQLGVLPLIPAENYFFFDSRSNISLNRKMSMAQLTNFWVDQITSPKTSDDNFCYPKVWIPKPKIDCAAQFCNKLRNRGARQIITINFGTGGNRRKRTGKLVEEKLLIELIREPDTIILLDKGFGEEEINQANELIQSVKESGYSVQHKIFGKDNDSEVIKWGLIGMQNSIGEIAALIANSDEYIGYDSACQHIAATLEIPCLTIFAGSNNMRFIRRWRAYGKKIRQLVHLDTLSNPDVIDADDIITRIMNARSFYKNP